MRFIQIEIKGGRDLNVPIEFVCNDLNYLLIFTYDSKETNASAVFQLESQQECLPGDDKELVSHNI
jgi:hypothetical protein